jgi:hypothetical protein
VSVRCRLTEPTRPPCCPGAADLLGEPSDELHLAHQHLGRVPERPMGRLSKVSQHVSTTSYHVNRSRKRVHASRRPVGISPPHPIIINESMKRVHDYRYSRSPSPGCDPCLFSPFSPARRTASCRTTTWSSSGPRSTARSSGACPRHTRTSTTSSYDSSTVRLLNPPTLAQRTDTCWTGRTRLTSWKWCHSGALFNVQAGQESRPDSGHGYI